MAFCPSCGSQNPDGSKFCTGCGAKFGSSDANPGFSSVGGQGYDFEIKDKPVFSILNINLKSGQSIVAEAGAMVTMSSNVTKTEEGGSEALSKCSWWRISIYVIPVMVPNY